MRTFITKTRYNNIETYCNMKSLVKILAVVGTGMLIGTVAGKYLKSERRQSGKNLRDYITDSKLFSRTSLDKKQAELEMYFI